MAKMKRAGPQLIIGSIFFGLSQVAGRVACLVLATVFTVLAPLVVAAEESPAAWILAKRFTLATAYYQNILFHGELAAIPSAWDDGIRGFRRLYLAAPEAETAPEILYMMGRMYHDKFQVSGNPLDLGEAIAYFQDVDSLFHRHSRADDAMLELIKIYLHDQNDRQRAARALQELVVEYPDSDVLRSAGSLVFELKDILPASGAQLSEQILALVQSIKFWSNDDYTRIVVKLSEQVPFQDRLLEEMDGHPRRLYIDFAHAQLDPMTGDTIPIQDGLLKRVRTGQYTDETVRVVLDIESISKYKIFSLQDPFRVVIDVKGRLEETPSPPVIAATTKKHPKAVTEKASTTTASQAPVTFSLARQLGLGVRRIVIDPGHGGKDPGAIGKNGLLEKDIVLSVAKKLALLLENQLSCEVILTRDSDIFIPLEERTAIANTNSGDLFISLHVNAAPTPRANGVETYFLDLTNDQGAMRLAAIENATSESKMSDLQDILADLLNNNKKDESARLAGQVQESMVGGLSLKNLGVKQAPFYVLIGAQMPAILSEFSFISNPEEARLLQEDNYHEAIARYLATGVGRYINESEMAMLTK